MEKQFENNPFIHIPVDLNATNPDDLSRTYENRQNLQSLYPSLETKNVLKMHQNFLLFIGIIWFLMVIVTLSVFDIYRDKELKPISEGE